MVTTNDVRDFVKSESYINLLNRTILTLQLDFSDEEPESQMYNIEADSINKSNIELDKLLILCVDDVDKLIKFVELKLLNIEDDVDEYNEDEEDEDVVIELPFVKTFLIGYLIEFFFLKNDPKGLDGYLKAIGIPNYKKYSAELKDIYGQL